MPDLPGHVTSCLNTGKLAFLALLVAGGIVLQILACALYDNWWPMLSDKIWSIYHWLEWRSEMLPHQKCANLPLLCSVGLDDYSSLSESDSSWASVTKFLTGASAIGSIALPAILKHGGVIGWGAMAMELGSFFVLVFAIMCYLRMCNDDD